MQSRVEPTQEPVRPIGHRFEPETPIASASPAAGQEDDLPAQEPRVIHRTPYGAPGNQVVVTVALRGVDECAACIADDGIGWGLLHDEAWSSGPPRRTAMVWLLPVSDKWALLGNDSGSRPLLRTCDSANAFEWREVRLPCRFAGDRHRLAGWHERAADERRCSRTPSVARDAVRYGLYRERSTQQWHVARWERGLGEGVRPGVDGATRTLHDGTWTPPARHAPKRRGMPG